MPQSLPLHSVRLAGAPYVQSSSSNCDQASEFNRDQIVSLPRRAFVAPLMYAALCHVGGSTVPRPFFCGLNRVPPSKRFRRRPRSSARDRFITIELFKIGGQYRTHGSIASSSRPNVHFQNVCRTRVAARRKPPELDSSLSQFFQNVFRFAAQQCDVAFAVNPR